jgi:hypothetical protein
MISGRPARAWLTALALFLPLAAWSGGGSGNAARSGLAPFDAPTLRDFQERQRIGVRLLTGVAEALPELAWLDRMTLAGATVTVEGRAFNTDAIATFVDNLGRLKGFTEPTLVDTQQIPENLFRFTVRFQWDAVEPATGGAKPAAAGELQETLLQLRKLVEEPGFAKTSFVPGTKEARGGALRAQPVAVRFEADSFHQAAMFFDRLNRLSRIVALKRMTLAAVAPRGKHGQKLDVDLSLEIPVVP